MTMTTTTTTTTTTRTAANVERTRVGDEQVDDVTRRGRRRAAQRHTLGGVRKDERRVAGGQIAQHDERIDGAVDAQAVRADRQPAPPIEPLRRAITHADVARRRRALT